MSLMHLNEMEKSITLCGKKLKVVLPAFYFHGPEEDGSCCFSPFVEHSGQNFYDIDKGYRHISLAELADLINIDNIDAHSGEETQFISSLLLSYFLKRGIDLEKHDWRNGIYTNVGIRREGQDLVIFRDIDRKIEVLTGGMWDSIVGYKLEDNVKIESQKFNLERLFRKYGEKLNDISKKRRERVRTIKETIDREIGSMETLDIESRLNFLPKELRNLEEETISLKQLDKSNPDMIDYLFQREYDGLPKTMQQADFVLPPDILRKEEYDLRSDENIWPMSVDISFGLSPKRCKTVLKFDCSCNIVWNNLTIYPFVCGGGYHLLAKEANV